ncbi:hypothetical protein HY489_02300 [Candidatus Woesearchaeota archaeon]|nr:hypothetical protein [Candidatus Woesearchaeota archaeon]
MRKAQFPVMSIAFLLIFVVFATMLAALFLWPAIEVIVNIGILYLVFLRVSAQIRKYKREQEYAIAFVASLIVLLLAGNLLPLWKITTLSLFTILFAELYRMMEARV